MKINVTLADICRPEDWLVTYYSHLVVTKTTKPEIAGEDLLALAANQRGMPGVITIQEAEYLGLPHTIHYGFALLDDNAKEAWLGLSEKIHTALGEAEVEPCHVPEGMNAYYLLEFDICES